MEWPKHHIFDRKFYKETWPEKIKVSHSISYQTLETIFAYSDDWNNCKFQLYWLREVSQLVLARWRSQSSLGDSQLESEFLKRNDFRILKIIKMQIFEFLLHRRTMVIILRSMEWADTWLMHFILDRGSVETHTLMQTNHGHLMKLLIVVRRLDRFWWRLLVILGVGDR